MKKLLLIAVMILSLAIFGCGEQAEEGGNGGGDNGEVMDDGGDSGNGGDSHDADSGENGGDDAEEPEDRDSDEGEERGNVSGFDFETPEMEVGQWIEYGADGMPQILQLAVVGTEMNQGDECYWVQISMDDFVGQVLVDAEGLEQAMETYEDQFGEFTADPETYIRENMAGADGMADMFGSDENMDMAIEFIKAVRMVKFQQQGMVMAVDLAGVPEWLEEMMGDPAFQENFQQGFTQGFNAEGGQEGLDTIMEELDNMNFNFEMTEVDVAGSTVSGMEFSISHPEGSMEAVISSELPILPLAYAEVTGDGETHYVNVRGFGFDGAENLLPGEPAQTIQAMMMLQGMQQQMGSGMGEMN